MCKCGERKCNEVCNTKRQSRLHQTDLAQLQNAQHVTITAIYAASMKLSQARVETCMDKLVWDNMCRSEEGCTSRVACLKGQINCVEHLKKDGEENGVKIVVYS
jgi:hypothetical protein